MQENEETQPGYELIKAAFNKFSEENRALRDKIPTKPDADLNDYIGDMSHIFGRMQSFVSEYALRQGKYIMPLTNIISGLERVEGLRASHPAKNVGEIYIKNLHTSAIDLANALASAVGHVGQAVPPRYIKRFRKIQFADKTW